MKGAIRPGGGAKGRISQKDVGAGKGFVQAALRHGSGDVGRLGVRKQRKHEEEKGKESTDRHERSYFLVKLI